MQVNDVLQAWGAILQGRSPSLSIEVTRECPLRCPGCYAYEPDHLGGGPPLRELADYRGQALIDGVLEIVDRAKPLHVSLVGGDPLVRHRELEVLVPQIIARGAHVQVVTSAFRSLPASWIGMKRLTISVSIDGLQAEHDLRRTPATYDRILRNIAGHRIAVHCTITAQMLARPGYFDEFLAFWNAREEVKEIWFSLFTPQMGAESAERLTRAQREQVVRELVALRHRYPKAELPERVIKHYLKPPASPDDCIFARTTETISADLRTRITPCQFGGNPDCSECGCFASMALASVGSHKVGGLVPVGSIFRASAWIGSVLRKPEAVVERRPDFVPLTAIRRVDDATP